MKGILLDGSTWAEIEGRLPKKKHLFHFRNGRWRWINLDGESILVIKDQQERISEEVMKWCDHIASANGKMIPEEHKIYEIQWPQNPDVIKFDKHGGREREAEVFFTAEISKYLWA